MIHHYPRDRRRRRRRPGLIALIWGVLVAVMVSLAYVVKGVL